MRNPNDQQRKRLEEEFKNEIASGKKSLPETSSQRILEAIHAKIEERELASHRQRRPPWLKWVAAASVVLLAGSIWRLNQSPKKIQHPAASPALAQTVKTNNTHHDLHLILSDRDRKSTR